MKMKMRPRYYCEHCGKGSGSAVHMRHHEKICTNNPNRECGMCALIGNTNEPIKTLLDAFGKGDNEGMQKLRSISDGCPACILSAIRQSNIQKPISAECIDWRATDFNFKVERDDFMKSFRDSIEAQHQGYYE